MEPTKSYLIPWLSHLRRSGSIFWRSQGKSENFILEVEWEPCLPLPFKGAVSHPPFLSWRGSIPVCIEINCNVQGGLVATFQSLCLYVCVCVCVCRCVVELWWLWQRVCSLDWTSLQLSTSSNIENSTQLPAGLVSHLTHNRLYFPTMTN